MSLLLQSPKSIFLNGHGLKALLTIILASGLSACGSLEKPTERGPYPPQAAIASAHPLATEAGLAVLASGGNAFDAAIAVAASLGVVEPYSAGIGGGGFWLLYEADRQEYRFIDAREKAPLAAHRDYYLDDDGKVNRDRAINGASAAAIPGQAAAFDWISKHYGQLPLTQTLAAAIQQANEGFSVDAHYRQLASWRLQALQRYPDSSAIFLDQNRIPAEGYRLRQPELGQTLQRLANKGRKGFYQGETAERLLSAVNAAGGQWSQQDLDEYRVVERSPIMVRFANQTLISAPPPSSGGVALGQMLQMLQSYPWQSMSSVEQTHLITEVMRRAYYDRAHYLGDPDFVDVPVTTLLSPAHIRHWQAGIDLKAASHSIHLGQPAELEEGFHTTHLSVLDQEGNMVSATLSINLPFGSAFTAKDTGILLNNEMDDFSAQPGAGNAYGLTGNEANAIAPGKRPLSSMSPSFLVSEQQTAIIGTPGGSRIISMVLLGMLEHLQGKPVASWVSRPRFHHQYLPDVIQHEPETFSVQEKAQLQALGHQLQDVGRQYGNMQVILWNKEEGSVSTAADPRGIGSAAMIKPDRQEH